MSYEPARIVSEILKELASQVKPGVPTMHYNTVAETLIEEFGAKSYNKNYKPEWAKVPYPYSICVNINGIIAHGTPSNYKLQEGDIVSLDLGIIKDGLCGDAGLTIGVGEISNANQRLLRFAKAALYNIIDGMKNGVSTEDLARRSQRFIYDKGHYTVNFRFAGHRIAEEMHMHPNIFHAYHDNYEYGVIKTGEIYCIEPMITSSRDDMGVLMDNGWTFVTNDGKPSAFFEHMVRVTDDGAEILTNHFEREGVIL